VPETIINFMLLFDDLWKDAPYCHIAISLIAIMVTTNGAIKSG